MVYTNYLFSIFSLISIILIGFLPSIYFHPQKKSIFESLFLSTLFGIGIIYFVVLFLGSLNSFTRTNSIIIYALILGIQVIIVKDKIPKVRYVKPILHGISLWERLLFFYIGFILLLEFYFSIFFPFYSWDAIASFNRWAVSIAMESSLKSMNPYYPGLVPFLYGWVYVISGTFNQHLTHVLSPIIGLVFLYYTFKLAEKIGGNGIFSLFLIITTPWFLIHLNAGYAEIFAATFLVSALYYTFLFLESKQKIDILIAGFLGGLAIATKVKTFIPSFSLAIGLFLVYKFSKDLEKKKILKGCIIYSVIMFLIGGMYYLRNFFIYDNYLNNSIVYASNVYDESVVGKPFFYISNLVAQFNIPINIGDVPTPFLHALNTLMFFLKQTPLIVAFIFILGIFALLIRILKKNWSSYNAILAFFIITYLIYWFAILFWDMRYLIYILPAVATVSSRELFYIYNIKFFRGMKLKNHNIFQIFLSIIIIALLLHASVQTVEMALRGTTTGFVESPSIKESLTDPFASDEKKLSMVLGDVYNVSLFMKKELPKNTVVLIMDPRIRGFLPDYHYSSNNSEYIVYRRGMSFRHWNKPYWYGTVVERNLRHGHPSPFFSLLYEIGDYEVLKINNEVIERSLSTFIGKSKINPNEIPFSLNDITKNKQRYNYIWLEAEDFSGFIGGKNGWEKMAHKGGILSGGNSIFSKAGASGGKTVSKSFQINVSGEYALWLRSKRYPFDFTDYNVSLDLHPSQNVYRDFHRVNEEFWEWLKIGTYNLSEGIHNLSLLTTGNKNWAGIDVVMITNDLDYTPRGLKQPPFRIDTWGKPVLVGERNAYLVWQDNAGWHIRWTGNQIFKGTISTNFTFIYKYNFEKGDYISYNETMIIFKAIADREEDGIDFNTTSERVFFDLGYKL